MHHDTQIPAVKLKKKTTQKTKKTKQKNLAFMVSMSYKGSVGVTEGVQPSINIHA